MDMLLVTSNINSDASEALNWTEPPTWAKLGPKAKPVATLTETSVRNDELDVYMLDFSKPAEYEICWLPDEY
jgi:hypothetical protein